MGYRIVSAPVKLVLDCSHSDGCPGELTVLLDPRDPLALARGKIDAWAQGWFVALGDEEDLRTLPRVYCPEHAAEGGFRRRVLGMRDGE